MSDGRTSEGRQGEDAAGDRSPEDRLEAALDRIAKVLDAPDPVALEVAERLDRMIASVRRALDK